MTVTVSGTTGTLYVNGTAVGTNQNITIHPASLGTTTQNWRCAAGRARADGWLGTADSPGVPPPDAGQGGGR